MSQIFCIFYREALQACWMPGEIGWPGLECISSLDFIICLVLCCTILYSVHCPKNILKLCIKTEPVTAGAIATILCASGYCEHTFCTVCRLVLLHLFRRGQTRFLNENSEYL